jgi:hypothetical protein
VGYINTERYQVIPDADPEPEPEPESPIKFVKFTGGTENTPAFTTLVPLNTTISSPML